MSQYSTCVTTFRGDMKMVASLARFFLSRNEPLNSLADIPRMAAIALCEMVVAKNPNMKYDSLHEALQYLESIGLFDASKKKRNTRTILDELSLEDLGDTSLHPQAKRRIEVEGGYTVDEFHDAMKRLTEIPVSDRAPENSESDQNNAQSILSRPDWAKPEKEDK